MSTTIHMSNNFTQGMVSRKARRLYSSELLASSASEMENVVPQTTGGFRIRPGLRLIYTLPSARKIVPICRSEDTYALVNMRTGEEAAFNVVHFSDRISADMTDVENNWKSPYIEPGSGDAWTAFTEAQMRLVRYAQTEKSLYLAERDHRPVVIELSGASESVEGFVPDDERGAYALDQEGHKLASKAIYDYDGLFTESGKYPSFVTVCAGRLWFANSRQKTQFLWASRPFDYDNFQDDEMYLTLDDSATLEQYLSSISQQGKVSRCFPRDRIDHTQGAEHEYSITDYNWNLGSVSEYDQNGQENPSAEYKVEKTVSTDTNSGYTMTTWSFYVKHSEYQTVHGQSEPTRIGYTWSFLETWYVAEELERTYVSDTTVTSDCAMHLEVGSDRNDSVAFIAVSGDIYVGSVSSEFMMERSIDATNAHISRIGSFGSDPKVQVAVGNNNIYYAETGRKGIRTVKYGYYGPEFSRISAKCPELFEARIREMFWQRVPHPHLYVILEDGTMAVLCEDGSGNVSAWAHWTFSNPDGQQKTIISGAVLDNENGQDVYLLDSDGHVYLLDDTLYEDDGEAIHCRVRGNFIDSAGASFYFKSAVRYCVDSIGTPFCIGQEGNELSPVDADTAQEHENDMVRIGAWNSGTDSFRWEITNESSLGSNFEILSVSIEMEVS